MNRSLFFILVTFMIVGCGSKPPIPFTEETVLNNNAITQDDGQRKFMQVLVSPTATPDQIVELGKWLLNKYNDRSFVTVTIYDDFKACREFYEKSEKEGEPFFKECEKHTLAQAFSNKANGNSEVKWLHDVSGPQPTHK